MKKSSIGKASQRNLSKQPDLNNKSSLALLTQNSTSSRKKITSHSPLKIRGKDWINKVDDLIGKFDESFRQNEIQQKHIREAQQELEQAKKQILKKMNEQDELDYDSEREVPPPEDSKEGIVTSKSSSCYVPIEPPVKEFDYDERGSALSYLKADFEVSNRLKD